MICAGIDAGSRTIKVVLLEADGRDVLASAVVDQGVEQEALAMKLVARLLQENNADRRDLAAVVATGYGRKLIGAADETITEITCQAWGVRRRMADARTIVDIGGQDSKLLRLNPNGRVDDFVMNDRCAAGTGRFLEVVATRLGVTLGSLGELASKSRQPAVISSTCVVFAETEIIGLMASGATREDIAAGVQASIATRVAAMARRNFIVPIVFTGGVAMVPGMDAALESAIGEPIAVAPDPQTTGALGAAILAARRLNGENTAFPQQPD
ncbi:MAG: 2-hydroxyglutaryl-CoA dehydratase [Planctomycetes bacterium]|nr:2-hydroxyglutaryl-CoA dehydratase [Planctomycetota bacterium]